MKVSAGIVIIKDNKILLGHPTNAKWYGTYSIPKGGLEGDEDNFDAALRETSEEVGITIPVEMLRTMKQTESYIDYKNKKGHTYKRVYFYILDVSYDSKKYPDILPKTQLQLEEVDWAGFLDYEEAEKKIFWRFKPMLEFIK